MRNLPPIRRRRPPISCIKTQQTTLSTPRTCFNHPILLKIFLPPTKTNRPTYLSILKQKRISSILTLFIHPIIIYFLNQIITSINKMWILVCKGMPINSIIMSLYSRRMKILIICTISMLQRTNLILDTIKVPKETNLKN
jgi:hypothetical protein